MESRFRIWELVDSNFTPLENYKKIKRAFRGYKLESVLTNTGLFQSRYRDNEFILKHNYLTNNSSRGILSSRYGIDIGNDINRLLVLYLYYLDQNRNYLNYNTTNTNNIIITIDKDGNVADMKEILSGIEEAFEYLDTFPIYTFYAPKWWCRDAVYGYLYRKLKKEQIDILDFIKDKNSDLKHYLVNKYINESISSDSKFDERIKDLFNDNELESEFNLTVKVSDDISDEWIDILSMNWISHNPKYISDKVLQRCITHDLKTNPNLLDDYLETIHEPETHVIKAFMSILNISKEDMIKKLSEFGLKECVDL